jgi:hypothetical protein
MRTEMELLGQGIDSDLAYMGSFRFVLTFCLSCISASHDPVAARGYRATRDNHHYRVIQSLEFTTAPGGTVIGDLQGLPPVRPTQ